MSRPKHFWFRERLGEIELVPRLVVLLKDVNKLRQRGIYRWLYF